VSARASRAPARRILIVDADPTLRTIATLHLGEDVDLAEAADPDAALEVLREGRIDAVLCALHGSRTDGAHCLRKLRSDLDTALQSVPVLLVVDERTPEIDALCDEHAPAIALEAPVTGPRLAAAVRALTQG
jgi:CheY-like chemotaxis protein